MNAPVPISDSYIGPGSPSVWPRRASRACASCRRDKIRCDGARPCNACVKKGYPADQCTDGCEPCRSARMRCEDGNGKPCKRCRNMNIRCVDGSLASVTLHWASNPGFTNGQDDGADRSSALDSGRFETGVQDFSANTNRDFGGVVVGSDQMTVYGDNSAKFSRGTERAKLACVGCRRDNKKCDDHRPCSRCVSRSEECIHVARGPKLVKLRCEGCRVDNKKCEESRPCKYCIEMEKECVNVPRKGRGHGTRVKSACVSCRRDKIRCNGDRPCASCVKKGCECVERACPSCMTAGKGSECTHRKSVNRAGSPASDTPPPNNTRIASTTPVKEKDYDFIPSGARDDSRWISFATSSGAQAPPIQVPHHAMYTEQQHVMIPPANGCHYYPDSNNQVAIQPTIMHHLYYGHSSSNSTYFFDSGNYQLPHHMTSTSDSRPFFSGD